MNKEKDITVQIKSLQKDSQGETDTMEFFAQGKIYIKDTGMYITYAESEITGMDGTKTTIKIEENCLKLIRFGSINSTMLFQKGIKSNSKYETQYGTFDITIDTEELLIDIKEAGKSSIILKYNLILDKLNIYENELFIGFAQ